MRESMIGMGWVEVREARAPRACWREEGKIRRRTCATVEECERVLKETEECSYVPPAQRRAGRPAQGLRGHRPSITQYSTHGCRGTGCKQAWSEYRANLKARQSVALSERKHGMIDTYNKGCHCDLCDAAGAAYREKNRERRRQQHAARADEISARRRARRAAAKTERE